MAALQHVTSITFHCTWHGEDLCLLSRSIAFLSRPALLFIFFVRGRAQSNRKATAWSHSDKKWVGHCSHTLLVCQDICSEFFDLVGELFACRVPKKEFCTAATALLAYTCSFEHLNEKPGKKPRRLVKQKRQTRAPQEQAQVQNICEIVQKMLESMRFCVHIVLS